MVRIQSRHKDEEELEKLQKDVTALLGSKVGARMHAFTLASHGTALCRQKRTGWLPWLLSRHSCRVTSRRSVPVSTCRFLAWPCCNWLKRRTALTKTSCLHCSRRLVRCCSGSDLIAGWRSLMLGCWGGTELLAKVGMGTMTKQFVTNLADTALEWLEHGLLACTYAS